MLRTNQTKRVEVGRLVLSAAKPNILCATFQQQEPDFQNLPGQPNSYWIYHVRFICEATIGAMFARLSLPNVGLIKL